MNSNYISPIYNDYQNKYSDRRYICNIDVSRYESLKEAIAHKDKGSIVWLLKEGCPLNIPELDRISESPLHVSVLANDFPTLKTLLSSDADINSLNSQKQTALHLAFELRRREFVDELLRHCDTCVNPITVYGLSHFHIACVRNDWRVAHAYLQHGVNVNVNLEKCFYGKDYVYYRPLHLAVKYESFEVAELLLRYGANVDARDRFKRTALHLACRYNFKRLREILDCGKRTIEDIEYQVKHKNDQVDILCLLLRYGASTKVLDANFTPPIFHVFKSDYDEIRRLIQQYSIQIDNWEDLKLAFKEIQREKFYTLMERGADVKFRFDDKETLLHMVIDGRRLFTTCMTGASHNKDRDLGDDDKAEIADMLLKYGVDLEARNSSNHTALHMAIVAYYAKTVKVLLNHNASVTNVCFMHYKVPRREVALGFRFELGDMENFLDIIGMMLKRKSELRLSCGNELLVLRYLALDSSVQHLENCEIGELRRLLDFSDVNKINLAFCGTENSVILNRERIALVLEHVQKLQIAGLPLSNAVKWKYRKCSKMVTLSPRYCKAFVENCKEEIRKMKLCMVDRYASFYDLMFVNVNEIAVRVKNEDFRKAVKLRCVREFKIYGNIVIKQFLKGLLRSILLDSAKEQLSIIIERDLPDPCTENILGHLRNEDLCHLAFAFVKW